MAEKWRTGADGVLECVDTETGAVIAREKKKPPVDPGKVVQRQRLSAGRPTSSATETHHYVLDNRGRKLWVPKGTNPDDLPRTIYPYCQVTCDNILQAITEGATIREVGLRVEYPPAPVIYQWLRQYPEFKASMKRAREDRAEFFADKAIHTADKTDPKNVNADRLKVETYKWAAEVGNREAYGKSTKITGDPDAPLSFIIDTGIRREPIPVESAPQGTPELDEPGDSEETDE